MVSSTTGKGGGTTTGNKMTFVKDGFNESKVTLWNLTLGGRLFIIKNRTGLIHDDYVHLYNITIVRGYHNFGNSTKRRK